MSDALQKKLAVVVPTLNEAKNIEHLLTKVHQALESTGVLYEIIVVDDDSQDLTPQIVRDHAREHPNVRLLPRKAQKGLAGAVLHGWQHSDAELLGVIDADLQHPPELLPELLSALASGSDIVIASRYIAKDSMRGWNPIRIAISRASTWATLPLQRKAIRVKDPMSGFFIVRRSAIEGLTFETKGFKLLLEILVRGRIESAREVPFHFGQRHAGESKAGTAVALHFLQLLGKLSRDLILKPSPQ